MENVAEGKLCESSTVIGREQIECGSRQHHRKKRMNGCRFIVAINSWRVWRLCGDPGEFGGRIDKPRRRKFSHSQRRQAATLAANTMCL